jgi:hypothetical protein
MIDPTQDDPKAVLIGKFPEGEVPSNLHRLKEVMEVGKVTDTSYSVPGKFTTSG